MIGVDIRAYYRVTIGKLPADVPQSVIRIVQWGRWIRGDLNHAKNALSVERECELLKCDAEIMGSTSWWYKP